MAEVTVFVDDAVRGTLPFICVKDGIPTEDRLTMRCAVGGAASLGVAWLLVLAGPLGWIALAVIASRRRSGDWLTVRLPWCERAYQRYRAARRMMMIWLLMAFVAALLVPAFYMVHRSTSTLAAVAFALFACATLCAGIRELRIAQKAAIRVDLDASRRWVTLSRVHPDFVQALQDQREADHIAVGRGARTDHK